MTKYTLYNNLYDNTSFYITAQMRHHEITITYMGPAYSDCDYQFFMEWWE
jgi:hypothetical protein